jgi:hypothetical protein
MKIQLIIEGGPLEIDLRDLHMLDILGVYYISEFELPDPYTVRVEAETYEEFCLLLGCDTAPTAFDVLDDLFLWYCSLPVQFQSQEYFEMLCSELWNCK